MTAASGEPAMSAQASEDDVQRAIMELATWDDSQIAGYWREEGGSGDRLVVAASRDMEALRRDFEARFPGTDIKVQAARYSLGQLRSWVDGLMSRAVLRAEESITIWIDEPRNVIVLVSCPVDPLHYWSGPAAWSTAPA